MMLTFTREPIPGPLPSGVCPACGRRRVPYLPECLCGHLWEDIPVSMRADAYFPLRQLPPADGALRVVHWSDLHLGSRSPDGVRAEVRLRALLALLHRIGVELLIVSGDLTRFGTLEELEEARALLAEFGYSGSRLVVVPGNHDVPRGKDASNFCAVFGMSYPAIQEPIPGFRIIALDSNVLQDRMLFERQWVPVRGRVGETQLAALQEQGGGAFVGATFMVLHHHLARLTPESPWHPLDERLFRADMTLMTPLIDADQVLAAATELGVDAVLHGHKHWASRSGYRVGAIPVFNAGSITQTLPPRFRIFEVRGGKWVGLYRADVVG